MVNGWYIVKTTICSQTESSVSRNRSCFLLWFTFFSRAFFVIVSQHIFNNDIFCFPTRCKHARMEAGETRWVFVKVDVINSLPEFLDRSTYRLLWQAEKWGKFYQCFSGFVCFTHRHWYFLCFLGPVVLSWWFRLEGFLFFARCQGGYMDYLTLFVYEIC